MVWHVFSACQPPMRLACIQSCKALLCLSDLLYQSKMRQTGQYFFFALKFDLRTLHDVQQDMACTIF